jgi:hypothetical protein
MELLILFSAASFDLLLALSSVWATWICAHYPPDDFSGWINGGPLVPVSLHVLHCTALPLLWPFAGADLGFSWRC